MAKISRRAALVACALLSSCVLAACGGDDDDDGEAGGSQNAGAGAPASLKFMQPLPKSIAFYPYFVAEELGYFEEENVEVELVEGDGGAAVTLQLAGGNVDIASAPAPDVLSALTEGQDWRVIYDDQPRNVFSIVVPEASDIQTVQDLEGKNLGITSQSGGEVGLVNAVLGEANLEQDTDVKITVVGAGGPQVARAIESGTIDAYAAAVNDIPALQAAGLALRDITPDKYAILPSAPFVVPSEWIAEEQNRDATTRFLRAWSKAAYVGTVNADVVYTMAEKAVPEETGDEAFARPFLELAIGMHEPPGDVFGEPQEESWTTIQEMLVAGEAIPEVIPPGDFLDESLLETVNDWDRAEVEAEAEAWAEENQ